MASNPYQDYPIYMNVEGWTGELTEDEKAYWSARVEPTTAEAVSMPDWQFVRYRMWCKWKDEHKVLWTEREEGTVDPHNAGPVVPHEGVQVGETFTVASQDTPGVGEVPLGGQVVEVATHATGGFAERMMDDVAPPTGVMVPDRKSLFIDPGAVKQVQEIQAERVGLPTPIQIPDEQIVRQRSVGFKVELKVMGTEADVKKLEKFIQRILKVRLHNPSVLVMRAKYVNAPYEGD